LWLVSKPDGWRVTREGIWKARDSAGRDQVGRILAELESTGYLRRRQRKSADGRWIWEADVSEEPLTENQSVEPLTENPATENQSIRSKTDLSKTEFIYTPEFQAAWIAYPKRAGGHPKKKAFRAWKARIADGHPVAELRAAVDRYRRFCDATRKTGTELVLHMATFFGPDERWADSWEIPPSNGNQRAAPFKRDEPVRRPPPRDDGAAMLEYLRSQGMKVGADK
jgi:hypothetical protein